MVLLYVQRVTILYTMCVYHFIGDPLPYIFKAMDGEMYDKVRNAYGMYARIEADAAIFIKAEYEDLSEQAHLVSPLSVCACIRLPLVCVCVCLYMCVCR